MYIYIYIYDIVENGTEGMRQEPRVQVHTTPVPHTPHDPGSCLYLHTQTHRENTAHLTNNTDTLTRDAPLPEVPPQNPLRQDPHRCPPP